MTRHEKQSPDAEPLVTVVISARNRPEELRVTFGQLARQTYSGLEVIVIDDASHPSLEPVVRVAWPNARYLRNETARGYVANRSFAMRIARGEYILSLDDDSCLADPEDLAKAVERMEREPQIGIITFFVHNGPEPPSAAREHNLQERYVHTFIGCGHIIRKRAVETVGGYRDFFVYYGEEAEYSLRALEAGWRILFFPSVLVHHRVSASGRSDTRIWGYSARNNLWTILLDVPAPAVARELAWKILVNGFEMFRRLELRWGVWSALSFFRGLPRVLRLRAPVSTTTFRLFDALRFRSVRTPEALQAARPPSLRDRWRWFTRTWWHRRRSGPFWQTRAGGIGRSACASFSGPQTTGEGGAARPKT